MIVAMVGIKRLIILAVLLGCNVALFMFTNALFTPTITKNNQDLSRVKKEVARYQKDLNSIRNDLDQLGQQQDVFEQLRQRQFFAPVDLTEQQAVFLRLEEEAGIETKLSILPETTVNVADLDRVPWKVVKRSVVIEINALDDVDIYRYLDSVFAQTPGYVKVKDFTIRRNYDFNGDLLRQIVRGHFPEIMGALLEFDWYFMVPTDAPAPQQRGRS